MATQGAPAPGPAPGAAARGPAAPLAGGAAPGPARPCSAPCAAPVGPEQWAAPAADRGAVTARERRRLHLLRASERRWLRHTGRHQFQDFSDDERARLGQLWDALCEGADHMTVDKLEEHFVALGLADTRQNVANLVASVTSGKARDLTFEDFLTMIKIRPDKGGELCAFALQAGSSSCGLVNAALARQRQLLIHAAGACGAGGKERGTRSLRNLARLQEERRSLALPAEGTAAEACAPDLYHSGLVPALGRLTPSFRYECQQHRLTSHSVAPLADDRGRGNVLPALLTARSLIREICPPHAREGRAERVGKTVVAVDEDATWQDRRSLLLGCHALAPAATGTAAGGAARAGASGAKKLARRSVSMPEEGPPTATPAVVAKASCSAVHGLTLQREGASAGSGGGVGSVKGSEGKTTVVLEQPASSARFPGSPGQPGSSRAGRSAALPRSRSWVPGGPISPAR